MENISDVGPECCDTICSQGGGGSVEVPVFALMHPLGVEEDDPTLLSISQTEVSMDLL